jgi:hypothetical protein
VTAESTDEQTQQSSKLVANEKRKIRQGQSATWLISCSAARKKKEIRVTECQTADEQTGKEETEPEIKNPSKQQRTKGWKQAALAERKTKVLKFR